MKRSSWLRQLRLALFFVGLLMLGIYVAALIHEAALSTAELARFKKGEQLRSVDPHRRHLEAPPDFSLWSDKRIAAYRESLAAQFLSAIAILRVPKIHVEAPVLEGTDELTLNRGVGRIIGTARPGETGNIGIAGHRDGFFRGLKDITVGDSIELVTYNTTVTYVVDQILVVEPSDISVLGPRPGSLTLVTCYPFYFIGSAPRRYVVQATIRNFARPILPMVAHADPR